MPIAAAQRFVKWSSSAGDQGKKGCELTGALEEARTYRLVHVVKTVY